MFVEEKIDQTAFDKKRIAFENKKEELDKKISQLSNNEIDSSKIGLSIDKIKYELQSRDMNNEPQLFDTGIFTQLIDYGIIGGINELGKKEPYMIRFICRKGFNSTSRGDITEEMIVDNSNLADDNNIYLPILDFISNQHFFVYDNSGSGLKKVWDHFLKKKLITKVRVRLEIEK